MEGAPPITNQYTICMEDSRKKSPISVPNMKATLHTVQSVRNGTILATLCLCESQEPTKEILRVIEETIIIQLSYSRFRLLRRVNKLINYFYFTS